MSRTSLRSALLLICFCGIVAGLVQPYHSRAQIASIYAAGGVPDAAAVGPYRTFLPLITNAYDPDYTSPFGVTMYYGVNDANGLRAMRNAGARRITTMVEWESIEPTEGARNWTSFDTTVRNARAAGMDLFVLVSGDPAWAWQPDQTATVPEKRLAFVRALVDRYDCDGVNDAGSNMCIFYWSFYAEPDAYYAYAQTTPGAQGYWGRRGKEYARMLAGVADVVHQENPTAKVLIGGIAYDRFDIDGGPFVLSFLPDVLSELNSTYGGATKYIDAVAFHYYPIRFPSLRDKVLGYNGVPGIRAVMERYGVGNLPMIVPETGYWSAESVGSSEAQQAAWLIRLYAQSLSLGIKSLTWYDVFDAGSDKWTWGLFQGKDLNRPKMAYTAYQVLTRELDMAVYERQTTQNGTEQYVFRMPSGKEKSIVWAGAANGQATFTGQCLRIVQMTGEILSPITDGDQNWDQDRTVNGRITLSVTVNKPVYVEACQ